MNLKFWLLIFALALLPSSAQAQISVHDLRDPGQFGAFLTPGQLDRWVFDGEKGEILIAHVVTKEFDPVLELGRTKDDDKPLLEVNDAGGMSQYMFRLPEKGQYKIRIHAFKYQGGGNYNLTVQRFHAEELTINRTVFGPFDHAGKSHHYFSAVKDQILIPQLKGTSSESWTMLDTKGRMMNNWNGTVLIEEAGEYCVVHTGQPGHRYELLIREARHREIANGKEISDSLQQGEMDVLNVDGKPGEFRVLEVEKKGELSSRLLFAPLEKKSQQRIAPAGDRPEIAFLPVASRGNRLRFAAILGREGRYQLQILAATPTSYKLTMRDPTLPIEIGKEVTGNLPVGGAGFYSFQATPGQLFQANLVSQKFVPLLRLYDAQGSLVGASVPEGDGSGRITHMVLKEGTYRLQVASQGDGGGGEFQHSIKEIKLKELPIGGRGQGAIEPGAMDFWTFTGKEGQTIFLNVRSATFDPTVTLRSPDGVQLATDSKRAGTSGSLMAMKLPKAGRYTVWVSSNRGAGEYIMRLIDAD